MPVPGPAGASECLTGRHKACTQLIDRRLSCFRVPAACDVAHGTALFALIATADHERSAEEVSVPSVSLW